MKSLYLAWQAPANGTNNRAWFPVGRLDAMPGDRSNLVAEKHESYRFRYTKGALSAEEKVGFHPLISFPHFEQIYQSDHLFPLFKNRVLSPKRPDFQEYIEWLDLTREEADPISILSISGGRRVTDSLHVFPKVEADEEGAFCLRFFVHGTRYLPAASRGRLESLKAGDELRIMVEVNNPATGLAVALHADDYTMIGFAPRYLVPDLIECIRDRPQLTAKIVKVNLGDAPLNQSLLVEYTGQQPKDYKLMAGPDFTPLIASGE